MGKVIFPSMNLPIAQKTMHTVRPKTSKSPLEVSVGMLVKGKQKIGNNTMTKNNTKNESLSKIFERISLIILYIGKGIQLDDYVDKSVFDVNNLFYLFAHSKF